MGPRKPTKALQVYQLKVTLRGSKPQIWRRIQVADDTSLHRLHHILQAATGWTDSHLHQFIVYGVYYGEPDPDDDYGMEIKNEKTRSHESTWGVDDEGGGGLSRQAGGQSHRG